VTTRFRWSIFSSAERRHEFQTSRHPLIQFRCSRKKARSYGGQESIFCERPLPVFAEQRARESPHLRRRSDCVTKTTMASSGCNSVPRDTDGKVGLTWQEQRRTSTPSSVFHLRELHVSGVSLRDLLTQEGDSSLSNT
jgi:hypothetical protein